MEVKRVLRGLLRRAWQAIRFGFLLIRMGIAYVAAGAKSFVTRLLLRIRTAQDEKQNNKGSKKGAIVLQEPIVPLDPTEQMLPAPTSTEASGLAAFLPQGGRFPRSLIRRWLRRAMVLCFSLALACILTVPILSSLTVKSIAIEGEGYYTEEELLSQLGVSVGDELLKYSEQTLAGTLRSLPYILQAEVTRSLGGHITVTVKERVAVFALLDGEGTAILLDDTLYALEICSADRTDVCGVKITLPPIEVKDEVQDTLVWQEQILSVGDTVQGSSKALSQWKTLSHLLDTVTPPAPVQLLDLRDPMKVSMTLQDGTRIDLGECQEPNKQIERAFLALEAYRKANPEISADAPLWVDAADFSRIGIRLLPQNGQ